MLDDATNGPTTGRSFTTLTRGLDRDAFAMRLFQKAKRFGVWNPAAIDLTRDAEQWRDLSPDEQEILLHLSSLFQAGEESVTLDLLPLIGAIAAEGRLEEEIYLTSFLWEEAKHVEAFDRFFAEVATGARQNLDRFEGPAYRQIFHEELPNALGRLHRDRSPIAQAEASVTYNMIVEGVLAETGYHAYHQILVEHGIMPGMQEVVGHLKSDEARHLAYGVFLLSRLVAEHGDEVWEAIESRMSSLLPAAIGVVHETFEPYPEPPFGLSVDTFVEIAMAQFRRRFERIAKARTQSLEDVLGHKATVEDDPVARTTGDEGATAAAGAGA
ncbi:MAG: R2-like ligand-binding oxidase [Acidobacteriota bacterium]